MGRACLERGYHANRFVLKDIVVCEARFGDLQTWWSRSAL